MVLEHPGDLLCRLYARQFKMIDYGLAKFDDLYCVRFCQLACGTSPLLLRWTFNRPCVSKHTAWSAVDNWTCACAPSAAAISGYTP